MEKRKSPRPETPPSRQRRPEDEERNQPDPDRPEDDIDMPDRKPKQYAAAEGPSLGQDGAKERAPDPETNSAPKAAGSERPAPQRGGKGLAEPN
jgi:hypothetical protein